MTWKTCLRKTWFFGGHHWIRRFGYGHWQVSSHVYFTYFCKDYGSLLEDASEKVHMEPLIGNIAWANSRFPLRTIDLSKYMNVRSGRRSKYGVHCILHIAHCTRGACRLIIQQGIGKNQISSNIRALISPHAAPLSRWWIMARVAF